MRIDEVWTEKRKVFVAGSVFREDDYQREDGERFEVMIDGEWCDDEVDRNRCEFPEWFGPTELRVKGIWKWHCEAQVRVPLPKHFACMDNDRTMELFSIRRGYDDLVVIQNGDGVLFVGSGFDRAKGDGMELGG